MVKAHRGLAWGAALACLCLGSCVLGPSETELLLGNYAYSRGEYQDATSRYLGAMDQDSAGRAWALYNLGNVYYSLGELEAALERWSQAEAAAPGEGLSFAIKFNQGIAAYNQGLYQESFELFKAALLIMPSSREAKVNLELAERKLGAAEQVVSLGKPSAAAKPGAGAAGFDRKRLLDFVEARESERWRAAEGESAARGNDW